MKSICCWAPPAHPCSSWRQPSWPCASSTAKLVSARLQLARKADEALCADCQSPWRLGCLLAWISLPAHEAHLTSQPPQCPAWSMGYCVTPACLHSFYFTSFLHSALPPPPLLPPRAIFAMGPPGRHLPFSSPSARECNMAPRRPHGQDSAGCEAAG